MSVVGYIEAPNRHTWMDFRLCRENPDLWFADAAGGGGNKLRKQAKAICNRCPVIEQCRSFVLIDRPQYGVWAALAARELQKLYRENPR